MKIEKVEIIDTFSGGHAVSEDSFVSLYGNNQKLDFRIPEFCQSDNFVLIKEDESVYPDYEIDKDVLVSYEDEFSGERRFSTLSDFMADRFADYGRDGNGKHDLLVFKGDVSEFRNWKTSSVNKECYNMSEVLDRSVPAGGRDKVSDIKGNRRIVELSGAGSEETKDDYLSFS